MRYNKCPIVLENSNQCQFCKSLNYILDKKKNRLNDKEGDIKRIRVDNLSPTKKSVIDEIRKQKHKVIQSKKRQSYTIQKLQGQLKTVQDDLNTKK